MCQLCIYSAENECRKYFRYFSIDIYRKIYNIYYIQCTCKKYFCKNVSSLISPSRPSGRAQRPFYIIASGSEPPNTKSRPTLTVQLQPIVCPIKIIPYCHSSDTWDDVICPSRPHVLAQPVPSSSDIGSALMPSSLSYCGNQKHKHN